LDGGQEAECDKATTTVGGHLEVPKWGMLGVSGLAPMLWNVGILKYRSGQGGLIVP